MREPLPRANAVVPNVLKWYACGPTVYDRAHLGHARAYVSQDILRRILEKRFRYNVFLVMGVTDVDDKIIKRAQERKIHFAELARDEERAFFEDMEALYVQPPNTITRVSEHMSEIIEYVEKIQKNGFAYESSDGSGVYFHTKELGDAYGKLDPMRNAHVSASDVQASDVEDDDAASMVTAKKDRRDFALWKASKEPGEPSWDSPWGPGRPGWHIECSAMTHHVLGDKLDLHSGGIDLRFPHHNNEIAQCEAHNCGVDHYHHHPEWCKHFVHFGHLYIQGLKMSKSLKNFISIKEFLEDHTADQFRLFCLQFKYRSNLHYSEDRIRDAVVLSDRIKSFFKSIHAYGSERSSASKSKKCDDMDLNLLNTLFATKGSIDAALRDDFNTPLVLTLLLELISRTNQYLLDRLDAPSEVLGSVAKYVLEMLDLLGLEGLHREFAHVEQLFAITSTPRVTLAASSQTAESSALGSSGEDILRALVRFRAAVREEALKNPAASHNSAILKLCDAIRNDELPQLGIHIEDLAPGRSIFKLSSKEEREAAEAAAIAAKAEAEALAAQLRAKQQEFEALMQIAPVEFFQKAPEYTNKFAAFDANGVPTHDANNELLTKSQLKKLQKKRDKHEKAYTKYWETKP
uniref:cysteine--tRNA ligase n=1 Tax=Globisporangium ultimum (strain ATCC 200006 / CBS 805.95 / DAOM BR144) TaxID=431595 RepID=K3W8N7_GLOUD